MSWLEMRSYMVSTLLRDTDSVSMAQSLEVRVPLLDTPLVEFVGSLPDAARQRTGTQKALLVEALSDVLAGGNSRPAKAHVHSAVGGMAARTVARAAGAKFRVIQRRHFAAHLHAEGVRRVWSAFLAEKTSWSRPWSLYVLNEWCRRHL